MSPRSHATSIACRIARSTREEVVLNFLAIDGYSTLVMAQFVSAALAPADVINATMQADNKSCRVIVPDDQLSLAIGKEGQNARLAAKLTGCTIDIAPESQGE